MLSKKVLLTILSFAVIIAGTAFTQSTASKVTSISTKKTLDGFYFSYIGPASPGSFTEYTDPDNYVLLSEHPNAVCEVGDDALCAVFSTYYWDGNEYKPDFSDTSWGNITSQLHDYYYYGLQGLSIYLKDL